jgi:hypothetical protein
MANFASSAGACPPRLSVLQHGPALSAPSSGGSSAGERFAYHLRIFMLHPAAQWTRWSAALRVMVTTGPACCTTLLAPNPFPP